MSGREIQQARSNARRLVATVRRSEQEPYDTTSPRRPPRVPGLGTGYCWLSSSLGPATGTAPSITPTHLDSIDIYIGTGSTPTKIGTFTVYNYRNVTWAAGKTTFVVLQGGTWHVIDQDC